MDATNSAALESASRAAAATRWTRSEAYEAILTAVILAVQDKLYEQELEEQTISADIPLLAIDLGARAAHEASTLLNPVYSPHTRPRPRAPLASPHSQKMSALVGETKREEKLRHDPVFEKLLRGRQEVMNRYRHPSDQADHHADSACLGGKPRASMPPAAVTQNLAQSTPARHACLQQLLATHAQAQDIDDASCISQQEPDSAKP